MLFQFKILSQLVAFHFSVKLNDKTVYILFINTISYYYFFIFFIYVFWSFINFVIQGEGEYKIKLDKNNEEKLLFFRILLSNWSTWNMK